MRTIYLCLLLFVCNLSLGQERRVWEIEKHEQYLKEKKRQDSSALLSQKYVPAVNLSVKSQFPIQHGIGLEFNTPAMVSAYINMGQLSRFYVVNATQFLPAEDEADAIRKQLIKDKLKNGFVFELGSHYHFTKKKDLYVGLNLQLQRFTLPTTAQELVEEYDFGDDLGLRNDVSDLLDGNDFLRSFYEETIIEPTIRLVQLGLTVGKRFHLKKAPRVGLYAEFSYQLNMASSIKLNSDSRVGQLLLDNFVSPILDEGTAASFGSFNLPTLTFRLSYQLGEKIYYRKSK